MDASLPPAGGQVAQHDKKKIMKKNNQENPDSNPSKPEHRPAAENWRKRKTAGVFNKQLHDDINQLKVLHAKKDKTEFNKMKAEIMPRSKISTAPVYRELKKDVPGTYKTPKYDPPIREVTEEEKEQVRGMLLKQIPIERIRSIMEKRSGLSYSWDRIDRIRSEIEKQSPGNTGNSIDEAHREAEEIESPYGDVIKEYIGRVMKIKKISPKSIIKVPMGKVIIQLTLEQAKEIQLFTANCVDSLGNDLDALANMRVKHLCYQKLRLNMSGAPHTIKELDETYSLLTKCNGGKALKEDSVDFDRIVEIVRFVKPKITREEVIGIVLRVDERNNGINPALMPPTKESKLYFLNYIKRRELF